ncbi:Uncharacterised protein [Legionella spiritensis]|nr:Uncharacterised protein [Legionella spiritensis]
MLNADKALDNIAKLQQDIVSLQQDNDIIESNTINQTYKEIDELENSLKQLKCDFKLLYTGSANLSL